MPQPEKRTRATGRSTAAKQSRAGVPATWVLLVLVGILGESCVVRGDEPIVLLLGDSISMGYAPLVLARLVGRARVIRPQLTGGMRTARGRRMAWRRWNVGWPRRANPT